MPLLAAIPWKTFIEVPIGPLTMRPFGLFVGLGILVGHAVTRRFVSGDDEIDAAALDRVVLRAVAWGLVGARLAWVATHLSELRGPLDVVAVWDGGLQFSGGFLAAVLSAMPWMRRQTPHVRAKVADAAALGLAPGLAIGRLGCIAVGEHLGGPTEFFLATRYLGGEAIEGPLVVGTAYHNAAMYELLHLVLLTAILWAARRAGRLQVGDGRTAAIFLLWYGAWRSITDLTRTADADLLGLTGAQWVAVLVLLPSALLLWRRASSLTITNDGSRDAELSPAA